MTKSTAEDLDEADRKWADAIQELAACTIVEAEKRVRRIRYDKKIESQLHTIAQQLGPRVVITNIEWSGPTMTDLTVSVVPAPVAGLSPKNSTKLKEIKHLVSGVQARAAMREDVSRFELMRLRRFRYWPKPAPKDPDAEVTTTDDLRNVVMKSRGPGFCGPDGQRGGT
jgi:hypothetical protein